MPQVSRYPLSKEVEERIFAILWNSIARLSSPKQVEKLFYDLLSTTERTMIAKRLSIALLLVKGYDYESIKKVLKVSSETIARVKIWLTHGGEGYKMVIEKIIADEKMREFWEKVEDVLAEALPVGSIGKEFRRLRAKRKPKGPLDGGT